MPPRKQSTDLVSKIEANAVATQGGTNVFKLLEGQRAQIERALPKHMSADRLLRVVTTELRRNPQLGECSPVSLLGALMLSAQLGLEPGPLGQCYLVPFRNGKTGTLECTFIVGYKGLINLALRSDKILSVEGHEICINDVFSFNYGTGDVAHTFTLTKPRGDVIGFWAKATLANGGKVIRVLSKEDVDARKKRSRAADYGPWVTDYEAMGIKTAIRVLCAQLPLAIEAERAIAADEATASIDGTIFDIPDDEIVDVTTGELPLECADQEQEQA